MVVEHKDCLGLVQENVVSMKEWRVVLVDCIGKK